MVPPADRSASASRPLATASATVGGRKMHFHHQIGFTDIMPLQSDEALRAAIADRLLTLPDDTKVYPGHREPTTIGEENAWGTLYRSSN